jgi:hypothetical protein
MVILLGYAIAALSWQEQLYVGWRSAAGRNSFLS